MQNASVQDEVLPLLVEKGQLRASDIERVERIAATSNMGRGLGYHLVRTGMLRSEDLVAELSEYFRVPGVNLAEQTIPADAWGFVPKRFIQENHVVPLSAEGRRLHVAMPDPTDVELVDALRFAINANIVVSVADEYSLESAVDAHFGIAKKDLPMMGQILAELERSDPEENASTEEEEIAVLAMKEEIEDTPVVRLISYVLSEAVIKRASDIHFECGDDAMRIRYRIDGSLVIMHSPPKKWWGNTVARLKVMAKLNTSERRRPQDGRIRHTMMNGRVVDYRVSTLPTTVSGKETERVVLRILDKTAVALELDSLGMDEVEQSSILQTILSPYGMILTSGPTGSGKTTTQYSILARLNKPDVNILTVEDPVEYDFPGINQTEVREELGVSFAEALRTFLRQDPDVIMLGEIRDAETAKIAVRAALTGHFVLSTLHADSAILTLMRLAEMGVERGNIASAVSLVCAQRLVRRICDACKEPTEYSPADLKLYGVTEMEAAGIRFMQGRGCEQCNSTGFRGRVGLYEILRLTPDIQELILDGAPARELMQRAILGGMKTLRMTGMEKVRQGVVSLDEVVRETIQ
jgi:type IV pilus assembly protein PilB